MAQKYSSRLMVTLNQDEYGHLKKWQNEIENQVGVTITLASLIRKIIDDKFNIVYDEPEN